MRRLTVAAVAAASLLVAGCGGSPGDILGVGMSGGPLPKPVRIHVTEDGRGSCNSGQLHELPSSLVLDARNVVRDAKPLTEQGASFGRPTPGQRNFELRTPDGTVTWAEAQPGLPTVLPHAEELALELQRDLC